MHAVVVATRMAMPRAGTPAPPRGGSRTPMRLPRRRGPARVGKAALVPATLRAAQTRSRWRHALIVSAGLLMLSGCVRVNPRPDYHRASDLLRGRTGVSDSYSPDVDEQVADKVDALLEGGLTVDEAVQVALLNNRGFQALFEDIGVSRAEVVQSGLLANPSLGLSLRFPEGGGLADLTVGFAQQIADLWRIPVRKRIARNRLDQTILSVTHEGLRLAAETRRHFFSLLALRQIEQITRENLKLAERSAALAQDRFAAGEVGRLDVNLARANVLDVRRELILIERDRKLAREDLAHTLGLSRGDQTWTIRGPLPDDRLPRQGDDALLLAAMRRRLDARAASLRVRAAEQELRKQYLDALPDVTVGFELERAEQRALPGRNVLADTARASIAGGQLTAPDIQSRGERRLERSQIIDAVLGPTLDITLPIWHQNQASIARARIEARQRRKEFEHLLDMVARDVSQALISARSARDLVALMRDQSLPLAEQNVEAARRAYRAGRQGIIALIDAQKALIAQRRRYVELQRDYALALVELRQAVGGALDATPMPTSAPARSGK